MTMKPLSDSEDDQSSNTETNNKGRSDIEGAFCSFVGDKCSYKNMCKSTDFTTAFQVSFIEQDGKIVALSGRLKKLLAMKTDEQAAAKLLTLIESYKNAPEKSIRIRKGNAETIWVRLIYSQIMYSGKAAKLGCIVDVTDQILLACCETQVKIKLFNLSNKLYTAQEDVRKKIAIDLHDSVGQNLCALKMKTDQLIATFTPQDTTRHLLEELVPIIQNVTDELKSCIMSLRPPLLDDLGLVATLHWVIREFKLLNSSIEVKSTIDIEVQALDDLLKIAIYRIVQEAFNNITKHAKANQVTFVLQKTNESVLLSIKDDGIGFSLEEKNCTQFRSGLGLEGMQERVSLTGGRFMVLTSPGSGTTLLAEWENL